MRNRIFEVVLRDRDFEVESMSIDKLIEQEELIISTALSHIRHIEDIDNEIRTVSLWANHIKEKCFIINQNKVVKMFEERYNQLKESLNKMALADFMEENGIVRNELKLLIKNEDIIYFIVHWSDGCFETIDEDEFVTRVYHLNKVWQVINVLDYY